MVKSPSVDSLLSPAPRGPVAAPRPPLGGAPRPTGRARFPPPYSVRHGVPMAVRRNARGHGRSPR